MEFYVIDDEVWCKFANGRNIIVDEHCVDIVSHMFEVIKSRYVEAFNALEKIYGKSRLNIPYYKYRIVKRFIRCNFSRLDNTFTDIDFLGDNERFNVEKVECPIRGECPYEGVVCCAKQSNCLSRAEHRVAVLWFDGMDKERIAEELYLSPDTVNNHINNIYKKINVHDRGEFVKFMIANDVI